MLLRAMPDVSPINAAFRSWFYARWGRENCLILGSTRHAEYEPFKQRLSIKMASGGAERYFLDGRTVVVDDDNYLILNDGRTYGSSIRADREVESFSIFFRPGLLEEVLAATVLTAEDLLRRPDATSQVEFAERLLPHDTTISPVLRFIRHHIRAGVDDEQWYDEQLHYLAERMLRARYRLHRQALALRCAKTSTRLEICRRLALAADFIDSCYQRDIGLDDMARAACMSRHHFLRAFRTLHGVTPMQYLHRKRIQVARRLRRDPDLSMQTIAARVGFNSRPTFYRQLRRWGAEQQ